MRVFHSGIETLIGEHPDIIKEIEAIATWKTYVKGDLFAHPDTICRHIGFLSSGIFRVYHLSGDKEVTDYFNTTLRNPVVSSFRSFLTQKAHPVYVEAIEKSEVALISYEELDGLYKTFPTFERMGRLMAERNYLLALERIESLQNQTAADRYQSFLKQYPMLINQIPHHYIASYLGVTPESLSRIRKSNKLI